MRIVVLDGYTLNPGDLRWDGFEEMGNVTVYDRTDCENIVGRSKNAEILLTNKTPLTADTINKLPNLKYIGVLATGYNVIDVKAAADKGVIVTNIPTYGTYSVAQMVFSLLLELCQHVQAHSDTVKKGEWSNSPDFCYWKYPLIELYGKTMGIIGFGRIGRQVAKIADAFGMKIAATDSIQTNAPDYDGFAWMEVSDLLEVSDVLSLHCPLFPETEKMINTDTIKLMKRTALIINTSRGGLINDKDLAVALNNGEIAGAALDVLSAEPPEKENPLFSVKNCLITPHISWATKEARARLMGIAEDNLKAFIAGKPINTVKER